MMLNRDVKCHHLTIHLRVMSVDFFLSVKVAQRFIDILLYGRENLINIWIGLDTCSTNVVLVITLPKSLRLYSIPDRRLGYRNFSIDMDTGSVTNNIKCVMSDYRSICQWYSLILF